jgi:peptide/nickel transport system permease protein
MAVTVPQISTGSIDLRAARKPRSWWRDPIVHVLSRPLGFIGAAILVVLIIAAIFAPVLAPFSPTAQDAQRLLSPGRPNWLGTDEFGRDILSRILHGARVSLQVGGIAVGIAMVIGSAIGIVSGFFMGAVDNIIQRIVDIMLAFPAVILIIAISGVLGPSTSTAMLAIGIVYAPNFARIVRGPTIVVMQNQYLEAGRVVGASSWRLMLRYVLPNVSAPIIVQATLALSTAILAEATLSFLGLGTQPPDPSWGTMLGTGRKYMESAPHVAIFPGLAIAITVLGFNLLGDALRDALDPSLRDL